MLVMVETEIRAPVEVAWPVLVDWERQADWMRDADSVVVTSRIREGVGTSLAVRTRVANVPALTERLEVVEWEPPLRVVIAHRHVVHGTGEWSLVPAGAGCRFRWIESVSLPVPVLGELALLAYRPVVRRLMSGSSARFAALFTGRSSEA
jgi:hypothetical protein